MRRVLLLALWLGGCASTTTDTAGPVPERTSERALAEAEQAEVEGLLGEAYRFCHDPNVDIDEVRPWCPYVEELDPERCPGLVQTCAEDAVDDAAVPPLESGCNRGSTGGEATDQFAAPEEPPPPPPERPDFDCEGLSCEAPASAASLLQSVLMLAGALLVALLVGAVLRLILMAVMREREAEATPAVELLDAEPVADAEEIPELPSADLLASARRALDAGRLDEAVLFARSAALRSLGEAERVKLHRSRTDREYARMVRGDAEVYAPLREIFRAVERVRWGGEARPSTDRARSVLDAAQRIIGLVLAATLVLVLAGAAWEDRYGADGDAALYELYTSYGYRAKWRLRPIATVDDSVDVLVLDLSHVVLMEGDREVLRGWVGDGGVLVVAGDASEVFDELGATEPLEGETTIMPTVDAWLDPPKLPQPAWVYRGGTGRTWVQHDRGDLVQAMSWGAGGIVAIADARLLSNAALVHPDNERLLGLAPLLGTYTSMWALDRVPALEIVSLNATAADSPMDSIANANLLPIVLQLLLLAIVAALYKGIPFRPLRDPPQEGRLSFAEHVQALGSHYARRRGSRRAASAYARLLLATRGAHLLEEAARRAGASSEQARDLIARAEEVANDPDSPASPAEDLALMEELWKIDPTR